MEYHTLSALFGVGRSTVGMIVVETCQAIAAHLLPCYVQIPQGDRLKEIVDGYETCWGFPQVAGAIDGSHIPILRPDDARVFDNSSLYTKGMNGTLLPHWKRTLSSVQVAICTSHS